ncbi:putative ribonuclease H-like domain-containing protein [Tanacetum coccineum]|uniref:Ribonuclease H-like domain-containing protein n=1 Tax=Tanacetum coccineum TaxID=301880 RepID=A0ABQ4WQ95_9ASTR
MTEQDSPPPTITAMKIPIIKKGEYDIWSMRMRQYICHTDHNLWDIIVDGDLQEEAAPAGEQSSPPAPKTAKQLTAKRNQERVKSILLLAIPDEYLLKFHNVPDAKSLWAAIKSRFGGNDESKKMQRNVLKHQFENFTTAPNESLDKAYDRFQMSSMGELTFFLGLQVKQQNDGMFISHDKYVADILKKFDFCSIKSATTPIASNKPLVKDEDGVDVDVPFHRLRATYGAELVSAASLVNTARLTLSTVRLVSMANLEFVDQHNMVVCLEKTEGNSNFYEIVDFLTSNLIHHALTVSPPIYTSYSEQFWNTTSSQTVNDVKQINATVDSKAVVVTEASIRSSLLFNDADVFLNNQNELGEPFNDVYPTPAHNLKVFTNMSRKGVKFSGKVTPLFDCMLVPHQAPKGEGGHTSDRSEGTLNLQELSILCTNLSNKVLALESIKDAQAAEISALKSRIKKLEKKCKPSISHHRAWLKSVKRLSMKKRFGKKESVSKQGRKKSKPESTLDDSTVFDDQDADHGMEYMETEEAVDEGRQSGETKEVKLTDDTEVVEDKSSGDKGGNAEELVSTARPEVSTARPDIDAARQEDSVVEPRTPPKTTSIFDDEDITMAQTLIKMKEEKAKEKGVSIKDVDDSSRPARSILTLKPLPTIDPKDKGKGVLKESPVKKVKRTDMDAAQIAKDAEITRLIHEKELAKIEKEKKERQRQDQASMDYIASLYDEVQAKMDASEELAARLQMEEREMYTIEERSKLLAEFFERRKKLLVEEKAAAVRNKPPTRTQLRSLMMTYIKHTDFVPIGSERDEKIIDKMNKKAAGMDEEEVPEEPKSTKVKVKQEGRKENIRKRSGRRLKMKATKKSIRQKTDSDLEEEEQLRASLKIVPNKEEEIDYEVLGMRYPIVNWESTFYHTDRYEVPHDYYKVFRANGSSRYIKTFIEMVSRFDRLDFIELHNLVMQKFSTTLEGIDLVLWGDLRIMFEETAHDDIWKNQEKWIIKSWTFYENYGVHILALEDGTKIYMLAERRHPLIRETLERMMELRLTAESEGEAVLDLLIFI